MLGLLTLGFVRAAEAEGAGVSVDCERGLVCRSCLCFDVLALLSVCSIVRTFAVCLVTQKCWTAPKQHSSHLRVMHLVDV